MSDSEHTIFIGVDGGGTGCRAAVGTFTDGILGQADGGRANVASDPELAIRNVLVAVGAAAVNAGVSEGALKAARAHLGLAGVMTGQDKERIASAVPFGSVVVTDDRQTAVNGALKGQSGYVLSVGTGTIAAAFVDGSYRSVGGWGFHVADQASGAWLGRAGLQHVLLCHDGLAEHTDLTRALFARFQGNPNTITSFSMSAKPGDYAAFAPEIVEWAAKGDPWGQSIMTAGADHLARCLTALGFQSGDTICLTGGVGPHYASYLPPEVLVGQTTCRGSALDGAFQLAKSSQTFFSEVG